MSFWLFDFISFHFIFVSKSYLFERRASHTHCDIGWYYIVRNSKLSLIILPMRQLENAKNQTIALQFCSLHCVCGAISFLSNKPSGCVAQIRRLVSWTNVEYEYHWCMISFRTPFFSQVVRTVLLRSFLAFAMPLAIAAASYLQRTQGQIQTTFPEGWGAYAFLHTSCRTRTTTPWRTAKPWMSNWTNCNQGWK